MPNGRKAGGPLLSALLSKRGSAQVGAAVRMGRFGRLNFVLPVVAGLVALALFFAGDRTDWNRGYGYDGTVYGSVAEDFPGAALGNRGIRLPGAGLNRPRTPLDRYYAQRIFPSALVWATREALGIAPKPKYIVRIFAAFTVAAVGLIALLWCMSADLLRLRPEQKLLGWMALILNFAALKASAYWPVTTDIFAYGAGAALLYFWLKRSTIGLGVVTTLGAFTWPTALWIGAALLAFPLDRKVIRAASGRPERRSMLISAAVAALCILLIVIWRRYVTGGVVFGSPPLRDISSLGADLFPLGVFVSGAFVFWGLVWLLPSLSSIDFGRVRRALLGRHGLTALGLVIVAVAVQQLIAQRSALLSETFLLKTSLPWSAAFPGVFLVSLIAYYGPLLALMLWYWPSVCRELRARGIGITLVAGAFLATALLVESRKALPLYPLMVPFGVMALRDLPRRRPFLVAFAALSLVASRFWLEIGRFPLDLAALREFPAQRFFMATGIWISEEMYLLELAAIVAATLLLLALGRRPSGLARAEVSRA